MRAELFSLWAFLFVVDTLRLQKVQLLGDSKTTVDWINGKLLIQVPRLRQVMRQIEGFLSVLEWFFISHIYRELNTIVDELSKDVLDLVKGTFCMQEFFEGQVCNQMSFRL